MYYKYYILEYSHVTTYMMGHYILYLQFFQL